MTKMRCLPIFGSSKISLARWLRVKLLDRSVAAHIEPRIGLRYAIDWTAYVEMAARTPAIIAASIPVRVEGCYEEESHAEMRRKGFI